MVDVATLRARVEVAGVQQAEQQLRGLGTQINTVGQQSGQASQQVDRAGQQIGRAGAQAGTAGRQFTGLRQGISQLSPVALGAAGAVVGVGLATKSAVDSSIAWESSLAGVAKTLDDTGLSAAGFDQAVADIGSEIRNMALEIPIAATELAGVAEAAGQLGIARENVVSFTETMAQLGVATDLTAEQSAVAIARISNITGLATADIDNFGNALVDLGNNSAATESEILNMATRIAAAGTNAGLTEGEILGLSAALTSVGVNAEAGGTALTQVFNEITTSVAEADDRLEVFAELAGQSAEQFAASWRSAPAAALDDFIQGLGRVTSEGGDAVLVLDQLGLDGIRVSQALNSLAGAGDLTADSFTRGNDAMTNTNALMQETERRFETTASKMQIAKNAMNEIGIIAGDVLAPRLADAAVALSTFIVENRADIEAFIGDVEEVASGVRDVAESAKALGDQLGLFEGGLWDALIPPDIGDRISSMLNQAEGVFVFLRALDKAAMGEFDEADSIIAGFLYGDRSGPEDLIDEADQIAQAIQQSFDFDPGLSSIEIINALEAIAGETFTTVEAVEAYVAGLNEMTTAADIVAIALREIKQAFSDGLGPAEEYTTELDRLRAMGQEVSLSTIAMTAAREAEIEAAIAANRERINTINTMNQEIDSAASAAAEWSAARLAALDLGDAISNVGAVTDAWRGVVDDSKSSMQLWEGDIRENEEALEALDESLSNGTITTEQHREATESLEWWNRRLQSGVEDMTADWALNRAAAAEVTQEMEELQRQFEAGEINASEYESASADLRAEWERQNDPLVNLIDKIDELITRLFDLDNTEAEPEVDVSTVEGHRAMDAVNVDLDALDARGVTASVDADTAAAHLAVAQLKAAIAAGAILPVSITVSPTGGGVAGGAAFQHGTGPGGVSHDMLALVGEEGPELAFLPQGTHILPNDETMRFLALFGDQGLPGFQEGTGGGPSQGVTGIDTSGFADVGTVIGEAISIGVNLSLIESGEPTGSQFATALIEGATTQIDTDGDEVVDAWIVAHDRIPELASEIGGQTVTALLEEYAALQGELQLAILSGNDTGEIQAQLDAIFALFAAWSGNAVEEVEAIWGAITDEAKAAEAEALWADILGSIQMPSAPISFDLEDLISGDAQQQLREDFMELWDLQQIFAEAGMEEQARAIGQQMAALGLQEEMIQSLLGTDTAQKLADQFAAMDAAAAQEALWSQILDVPIEALASGDFIEQQQAKLDELFADLEMAQALGLNTDALMEQIEEQEELLAAAGEAMATPVVEEFAAGMNEMLEIGDATLGELTTIFAEYPDIAEDMIDDVIQAVQDGRLPFEDAMGLLAQVPRQDLIPALEALEEQLTVKLAEALLSLGPDSPEVQAILASLGLIEAAANSASSAASAPLLNQKSGEVAQLSGGGGGGTPVSSSGGGGGAKSPFEVGVVETGFGQLSVQDAEMAKKIATGLQTFLGGPGISVDSSDPYLWTIAATSEYGLSDVTSFFKYLKSFNPSPPFTTWIDDDGLTDPLTGFTLAGDIATVNPFAEGGIFTQQTQLGNAMFADNPSHIEAVVPLERAGELGFGGMDNATMRTFAKMLADELRKVPPRFAVNGREITSNALEHLSSGTPAGWGAGA